MCHVPVLFLVRVSLPPVGIHPHRHHHHHLPFFYAIHQSVPRPILSVPLFHQATPFVTIGRAIRRTVTLPQAVLVVDILNAVSIRLSIWILDKGSYEVY